MIDMDTLVVKDKNIVQATRTFVKVTADSKGNVPVSIALVPSGTWPNSYKGSLEITISDLEEMAKNFNEGTGLPMGGIEGAPIDYSHMDHQKAAGWIKKVYVEGGYLMADVEWTPAGRQAIIDGEFKFISPSFYPACLGQWCDPEDPTTAARNVLLGAGLTNIPFFKGLQSVKASQSDSSGNGPSSIFISASREGEKDMPRKLEEILATPANEIANLSDEDKAVLAESKDQLSADQQIIFGLDKPADPASPTNVIENNNADDEPAPVPADAVAIQASITAGTHKLVATSEIESMKASITDLTAKVKAADRERIDADVKTHIARGAIKADQAEAWANKIEADATMMDMLKALPDNQVVASELGDENNNSVSATVTIKEKAQALIASEKEAGRTLDLAGAQVRVMKENPELAKQYNEETGKVQ